MEDSQDRAPSEGQDDLTVRFTTRDLCGNPVEMGCSSNNGPESSLPCAGRLDMTKAFHGFLLLRCMGAMFGSPGLHETRDSNSQPRLPMGHSSPFPYLNHFQPLRYHRFNMALYVYRC
jgi:hypothetical protein